MKRVYILFLVAIWFLTGCQSGNSNESDMETSAKNEANTNADNSKIYELRTYYASDDNLDNLLNRFQDHTIALFEKHGMKNIGYWVPVENDDNVLIYLLGFDSHEDRETSWILFREDADWIEAKEASEVNGALVDSVKSILLKPAAFSPALKITNGGPRIFEMRTYYTNEGKLDDLHARFRDHTMDIFENHGITNIVYFDFDEGQQGVENTLLYFISHSNREAADVNWQGFTDDPKWKSAYEASIEDGNLVDSLTSVYLKATDFSPLK